jgi:penicillin V acylase-like amidase (Ntn superfamily)
MKKILYGVIFVLSSQGFADFHGPCQLDMFLHSNTLSEKEIAAAFNALENAGYDVDDDLFGKVNFVANSLISTVLDHDLTLDELHNALPKEEDVVHLRQRLLGH